MSLTPILTGVNTAQFENLLVSKLSKDVTLCTDGSPVNPAFCQHTQLNHAVLKDQRILQHCFHMQIVTNYHQKIKDKYQACGVWTVNIWSDILAGLACCIGININRLKSR